MAISTRQIKNIYKNTTNSTVFLLQDNYLVIRLVCYSNDMIIGLNLMKYFEFFRQF